MANEIKFTLSASGVAETAGGVKRVETAVSSLGSAAQAAATSSVASLETIGAAVGRLGTVINSIVGLSFAGLGLKQLADMADTVTSLRARLELATGSIERANIRLEELRAIANRTQQPLNEVAQVYIGISRAAKDLGASQVDLMKFTAGVGDALRLSGTSAQSAAGALLQLQQMLGGTVVQAQEFNSLVDGAPVLLRTVAAQLGSAGVSMGELRQRVLDGKLSTQEFFQAFLAGAADLRAQADAMPSTIGGAFKVLGNNTLDLVGKLDDQYQVTKRVSAAVLALADNLQPALAALKIAAIVTFAYFRQTVLVPAVLALFATAKTALTAALVRYQLAVAISGSATAVLAAELRVANAATLTLTTSVGRLALGLHLAFAAVAGWQIGTILREQFLEVQLAGTALVRGLLLGWEAIKYGAQVAWAYVGEVARLSMSGIGERMALWMGNYGAALKLLGASQAGDQMLTWANEVRGATSSASELQTKLKGLAADYQTNKQQIVDITDAMADESIAAFAGLATKKAVTEEDTKGAAAKKLLSEEQKKAIQGFDSETDKLRLQYIELTAGKAAADSYAAAKAGVAAAAARSISVNESLRASIESVKAETQRLADAEKARAKAFAGAQEDMFKAQQKAGADATKHAENIEAQVAKVREENEALRYTKKELAALTAQRLDDTIMLARQQVATDDLLLVCNAETEAHRRTLEALLELKAARGETSGLQTAKDTREAWAKTADSIEQSLTDALMRGFESGRGFAESLKSTLISTFKTMVLKPIIQAQVKGVGGALQQVSQGSLGQAFRAGGAGGGYAALGDYASAYSGSTYGTSFGSQQSAMLAAQDAGMGTATSGFASAAGVVGAVGSVISVIAPYVPYIIAAGKLASGDIKRGFDSNSARNIEMGGRYEGAAVAGKAFAAVSDFSQKLGMSKTLANILSMSHHQARMFGHATPNIQAQGITGGFGGGQFSGQAFADLKAKGGWFRSDKSWTDTQAVDAKLAHGLDESAKALLTKASDYAKSLALPVAGLVSVTAAARIELGADEAANQKAIEKALGSYGDALANTYKVQLDKFARPWETLAETLERLAVLQQFSDNLNALGGVFSRVALLGVGARESLVELAGGMDALKAQALGFIQNYYGRDEIASGKAREIRTSLADAGITQDIATRDDFRALVEGTAVDTDLGRSQLAALLAVQGNFAELADYLSTAGGTLASAAAAAPAMSDLSSLFASGAGAQVDATLSVRDSVDAVREAVVDLARSIIGSGPVYFGGYEQPIGGLVPVNGGEREWEVTGGSGA